MNYLGYTRYHGPYITVDDGTLCTSAQGSTRMQNIDMHAYNQVVLHLDYKACKRVLKMLQTITHNVYLGLRMDEVHKLCMEMPESHNLYCDMMPGHQNSYCIANEFCTKQNLSNVTGYIELRLRFFRRLWGSFSPICRFSAEDICKVYNMTYALEKLKGDGDGNIDIKWFLDDFVCRREMKTKEEAIAWYKDRLGTPQQICEPLKRNAPFQCVRTVGKSDFEKLSLTSANLNYVYGLSTLFFAFVMHIGTKKTILDTCMMCCKCDKEKNINDTERINQLEAEVKLLKQSMKQMQDTMSKVFLSPIEVRNKEKSWNSRKSARIKVGKAEKKVKKSKKRPIATMEIENRV